MAWIDSILKRMVEVGASDLHMTSTMKPMLRRSGDIARIEECPELDPSQMLQVLMEIAPEANRLEFEERHDTDFAYEIEGLARFRANLFRDQLGPGAVLRVIPQTIPTVEQLGLPEALLEMCQLSKGLVVVTGPTGSGKSTTLAAMIDHINSTRRDHIITIEDPIEFVHPQRQCLINQRQVGKHTMGFKPALRAALREDPDIVLVGEMRDLETMEIAIETAETGHLVLGTLHTTTAASTVDRIIDQFPADRQEQVRTMLASSLKGVVAQTLCKRIGGGVVAALEVLVVTSAVSAQIREGKTHQIVNAMQTGGKQGMKLLNESLVDLVSEGVVSSRDAFIKAVDKEGFKSALSQAGIPFDSSATSESAVEHAPAGPMPPESSKSQAQTQAVGSPSAPLPSASRQGEGAGSHDPFEAFRRSGQR